MKTNTEGNKKFVWGFKVHLLADTEYELPLAVDISTGNLHDVNKATPLLSQARRINGKFHPDYVICDAAYSSDRVRHSIKRQFAGEPIIDPNPSHKKATLRTNKNAAWKMIYNRRTAIERLNSRLKAFRKLNSVRVRGRRKVLIHALMAVIVLQAHALATGTRASVRSVC